MSERDYRAAPGISQSALKPIARSPAHFRAGVEDEDDKAETEAQLLGRVVSTLVLEPDRAPWWCVKPDNVKFNEKEGREWAAKFLCWTEADGKFPKSTKDAFDIKGVTLLKADQFSDAARMATVIAESKKPEVRDMLEGAKREVSVFAEAETANGKVLCKSRPDMVPMQMLNVIADLKTCLDARPDPFRKTILQRGYDVQAASYIKNWNLVSDPQDAKEVFLILAIEKSPPYAHMVHRLDAEFMLEGLQKYEAMLEQYAYCRATGEWPDYPAGINSISQYRN